MKGVYPNKTCLSKFLKLELTAKEELQYNMPVDEHWRFYYANYMKEEHDDIFGPIDHDLSKCKPLF